jgi:hypothetical protein
MQAKPEDLARVRHIADPTRRVFAVMALSLDDGIGRELCSRLTSRCCHQSSTIICTVAPSGAPASDATSSCVAFLPNRFLQAVSKFSCIFDGSLDSLTGDGFAKRFRSKSSATSAHSPVPTSLPQPLPLRLQRPPRQPLLLPRQQPPPSGQRCTFSCLCPSFDIPRP